MIARSRVAAACTLLGAGLVGILLLAAPALAAGKSVAVTYDLFSPTTITIHVGDTVTWTNVDPVKADHNVTSNSFKSGTLSPGESYKPHVQDRRHIRLSVHDPRQHGQGRGDQPGHAAADAPPDAQATAHAPPDAKSLAEPESQRQPKSQPERKPDHIGDSDVDAHHFERDRALVDFDRSKSGRPGDAGGGRERAGDRADPLPWSSRALSASERSSPGGVDPAGRSAVGSPTSPLRWRRRLHAAPRGKDLLDLRREGPADGRPAEPLEVVRIVLREVRDGPSRVPAEVEASLGGAVSPTHALARGPTGRGRGGPPVGVASAIGFAPVALSGIGRAGGVVCLPTRGVREDRPRFVDGLHRVHAAAGIRVVLAGERSECGSDHFRLGGAGHLKDLVVVGHEPEGTRRIARGQ